MNDGNGPCEAETTASFFRPHTNYHDCDYNYTTAQGRYVRTYECRCPPFHDKRFFRWLYRLIYPL